MEPFELPEDLTAQTNDELESLHSAALAEFDELYAKQPKSPEDTARMREIRDALGTIKTEVTRREEAETEAEEIAQAVRPPEEEVEEPEAGEEPETPEPEAPEAPEASESPEPTSTEEPATPEPVASEPAPAPTASPDPAPSTPEAAPATSPSPEPATVAASAQPPARPSAAAIAAHTAPSSDGTEPTPEPTSTREPATLVASANLPNHNTGETLTMDDVVAALHDRIRGFPKGRSHQTLKAGVAKIVKPFADDLRIPEGGETTEYLNRAVDESQLPGGNLVAAGGWCAPSETIYDLCSLETTDGLLSLPSVAVPRGGIRHTTGPDFRAIYDSTGFTFTETDDEAGDYDGAGGDKPCAVIPCPTFTEDRLEVAGLCITSGILQDVAYPEMTRRFIEGALVGHAHRLNDLLIEDLVAGSDAVSPTAFANGGAAVNLLSAVELVGTDMRYRNRMSNAASLELVLPFWARGVVRADLSNRAGVPLQNVTDGMMAEWFSTRNVAVQYVYDWQDDLADGASGFGSSVAQVAWPTSLDFLVYPAGTWVRGEEDIITLDAIYDSVNLPKNNYTALFTEEGWMTLKRCHDSRVVTVDIGDCFGDANLGAACA